MFFVHGLTGNGTYAHRDGDFISGQSNQPEFG